VTFLTPLFLLAGLAAAIPVVLHMINRQRAKQLTFSTLRFLRISVQKTRRRKRIHDVFLMAVRAAVLLLIALGLSRPTLTHLSSLLGGSNTAIAIILDNSASMGVTDQGKIRFETALEAARQILSQSADGDQVALFLTGGRPYAEDGKLDRTHEIVLRMLNQLAEQGPSHERADLAGKIQQARKVLVDSEAPNRQIFVITDMQKLSWDGLKAPTLAAEGHDPDEGLSDEERVGRRIPVIIVDCNRNPQPNCAVQGIDLEAAVPVAGVPVKAAAEIFNASSVPQQRLVKLFIDEAEEATSPVLNVPAEGRLTHTFIFSFKRGGLHRGEVRLVGDDGSKLDDRRFFTMEVDQGIPVAVVSAQRHEIRSLNDTFYLEQALSPARAGGWAVRVATLTAKDLLGEPLNNYAVIYCVNLPALDGEAAERLRQYVESGGHVVWTCGDNVQPDAYNQMNQQAKMGLLPAPLLDVRTAGAEQGKDSWNISFLDKKHKALAFLVEPPSLYQSVLVYKQVRMDVKAAPDAWVLARVDDGEPLLVTRKSQRGSVTLLGTGVQSALFGWTNLPLRPIFLPLVARLTFELAGAEQTYHTILAGAPLVLNFDEEVRPITVEVIPPSGTQNRLPTHGEENRKGQIFRYDDTHDVGIYLLRPLEGAKTKQIGFSVNVDPDEAIPTKVDRDDLKERFGPTEVVFADDPDDLSGTLKALREGKSLWTLFLALVLAVLVFEVYVSNRLSPTQEEEELSKIPPGMRRLAKKGAAA
jgi:hypothetical protein